MSGSEPTSNRAESLELPDAASPASPVQAMDPQLLYASIIESSDDAIFVESLEGHVLSWNRSAETLYGYTADEMIHHRIDELIVGEDHNELDRLRSRVCLGERADPFETIHQHKDGSPVDVSINFSPIHDWAGKVVGVSAIVRDITCEKQVLRELYKSEERFTLASRSANDGLWDWDLKTDKIYFSPRWKQVIGYDEDDPKITDQPHEWFGRVSSRDLSQLQADLAFHFVGQQSKLHSHFRMEHQDGELHWMLARGIAVFDEEDNAIRIAGWLTDIHDHKVSEEKLRFAAQHDKLTDLPNRALFLERVNSVIKRHKRNPQHHFAILFLDFDHFKIINDSLGHEVGDQLLISIAGRLKTFIRNVDTAARLGGDEFVVLLDGLNKAEDVVVVAQRMIESFAQPHQLDTHEVTSTASIGIVTSDSHCDSADAIIRDADTAMYQAKHSGRGRFVMFDGQMHDAAVQCLELEKDLRKALDRNEFKLFYQPILCLESGHLIGFEALIRWDHPMRGLVAPDQFIALAEEINLIAPIGEWVFDQACSQLNRWTDQFNLSTPLTMNINVSKLQLVQPQVVQTFCEIIDRHGLDRSRIKLEITEGAIMDDRAHIPPVLESLYEAGIPLAMDDFGTGHSSLSCLHRFPISILKIDQSFVNNMDERIEFAAVIQAIVTLAHTLGVSVVAEGIETAEQLAQLQALECDHGQGYFFSKPMDVQHATQYLAGANGGASQLKQSA